MSIVWRKKLMLCRADLYLLSDSFHVSSVVAGIKVGCQQYQPTAC